MDRWDEHKTFTHVGTPRFRSGSVENCWFPMGISERSLLLLNQRREDTSDTRSYFQDEVPSSGGKEKEEVGEGGGRLCHRTLKPSNNILDRIQHTSQERSTEGNPEGIKQDE